MTGLLLFLFTVAVSEVVMEPDTKLRTKADSPPPQWASPKPAPKPAWNQPAWGQPAKPAWHQPKPMNPWWDWTAPTPAPEKYEITNGDGVSDVTCDYENERHQFICVRSGYGIDEGGTFNSIYTDGCYGGTDPMLFVLGQMSSFGIDIGFSQDVDDYDEYVDDSNEDYRNHLENYCTQIEEIYSGDAVVCAPPLCEDDCNPALLKCQDMKLTHQEASNFCADAHGRLPTREEVTAINCLPALNTYCHNDLGDRDDRVHLRHESIWLKNKCKEGACLECEDLYWEPYTL